MKAIDPTNGRMDLYKRIEKAAEDGKLTDDLAKWSHEVRVVGRDAVHDEDPFSGDEAKKLDTFTHLLLTYIFYLPGLLNAAKGEDSDSAG